MKTSVIINFLGKNLEFNLEKKNVNSKVKVKPAKSEYERTQPAIRCSKLTIETLEQNVKYVQS